jgi:hypothetical protein
MNNALFNQKILNKPGRAPSFLVYFMWFLFSLLPTLVFSYSPPIINEYFTLQLGGYFGTQGKTQHVDITNLIGDTYRITNKTSFSGLVGLGYYLSGQAYSAYEMHYGINLFFLPKTAAEGHIVQEGLFTNLAYHYTVRHYPLYAMAKSTMYTPSNTYALTLDAGIGPNFTKADNLDTSSLDGSTSIPETLFFSHSNTTLAATAGIGIKKENAFGNAPLECGYRFMYLGKNNFVSANSQVPGKLYTGTMYANAILCAIMI